MIQRQKAIENVLGEALGKVVRGFQSEKSQGDIKFQCALGNSKGGKLVTARDKTRQVRKG